MVRWHINIEYASSSSSSSSSAFRRFTLALSRSSVFPYRIFLARSLAFSLLPLYLASSSLGTPQGVKPDRFLLADTLSEGYLERRVPTLNDPLRRLGSSVVSNKETESRIYSICALYKSAETFVDEQVVNERYTIYDIRYRI